MGRGGEGRGGKGRGGEDVDNFFHQFHVELTVREIIYFLLVCVWTWLVDSAS